MNRVLILSIALLGFSNWAQASSNEAWQAHEKQVIASCQKASQLKQSKPLGGLIEYPDELGLTAVLMGGRYPQAQMKSQRGRELCLYDKKTGKAFISEADTISRP